MFFKGEIPFVRLLVPLIVGIAAGNFFASPGVFYLAKFCSVLSLCILIFLIIGYKKYSLFRVKWILGISVHVFIFMTAISLTLRQSGKFDPDYFAKFKSQALVVIITTEPQLSGDILRFETLVKQAIVNSKSTIVTGKLLIAMKADTLRPILFNYGDQLMIPGVYNEVDPPFNPDEFNFKKYLRNKQIYQQSFINQNQIRRLEENAGNDIIAFSLNLRKKLVAKFYTYLADKEAAAMASTLILGYRANLSKEIISAYSKTGTLHILSVSGMHVGIVFIVLNFMLKPLRKNRKLRFLSALIIISSIWFYALITGLSPSVLRAAVMLSFVILGKTFNKNLNTYNLLAISAFFLLLYNPFNLFDVGFQLSYLAVIGLVFLHPKIYHLLYIKNKLLDYAWSYSALSVAAQLATFPISIYYFHQFPVYFLLSNLLVVLPVTLIMYLGITFLFIPWSAFLEFAGDMLNALIIYTNKVLYYMEALPFSSIGGIWITTSQYILIYLIIASVIWAAFSATKKAVYFCLGSILLLATSTSHRIISNNQNQELIFYSLRKNVALAYVNNGKAYLISDLSNDDKTISFSIKPALESRGISQINNLRLADSFSDQALQVSTNYMQFGNFKVFRWDQKMDNQVFKRRLKSDIILLSGNPKVNLSALKDQTRFSMILIDATNFDYRIKQWKAEAARLKIPIRVLKKSPAYVLNMD